MEDLTCSGYPNGICMRAASSDALELTPNNPTDNVAHCVHAPPNASIKVSYPKLEVSSSVALYGEGELYPHYYTTDSYYRDRYPGAHQGLLCEGNCDSDSDCHESLNVIVILCLSQNKTQSQF